MARWRVIDTLFLASVRADMRAELVRRGYDENAIDNVALVMTELAGNAFQHGAAPVEIVLDAGPHTLVVRVTDAGDGFHDDVAALLMDHEQTSVRLGDVPMADAVAQLAEGGRGLHIAASLADIHVTHPVHNDVTRTVVVATLHVDAAAAQASDVDPLGVLSSPEDAPTGS